MITMKSKYFPQELQCRHILEDEKATECYLNCYFLGDGCKSGTRGREPGPNGYCNGHTYIANVKVDRNNVGCFGKPG